jgi:hypothetical protein
LNSKDLVIGVKNSIDESAVVVKNRIHLKPKRELEGNPPNTYWF